MAVLKGISHSFIDISVQLAPFDATITITQVMYVFMRGATVRI